MSAFSFLVQIVSKLLWTAINWISWQFHASIVGDEEARRSIVDAGVRKSCLDQSLKTMMEICARCLAKDPAERPSIEDVLWNLQFAAQVQDAWRGESQSSEGSPVSPFEPRRLTFH